MSHTPGPWLASPTASLGPQYAVYAEASGRDVAVVYDHDDRTEANAKLIAAAPDLLEACEAFVEHIQTLPDDTEKCRHLRLALNNRAGDMIVAAIAKAKGETP